MQFCSFLNLQGNKHCTSNMPYSFSLLYQTLKKRKRHGIVVTCVQKKEDFCKLACIFSTWNCFFLLSFKLRSFLPTPCLRPLSHRRPSLAQQCSKKGIMMDSPWCKLEYCSPITSPSRSSNETSYWDRSYWISICVCLAVGGYCLSKHWFVLLSFFIIQYMLMPG